MLVLDRKSGEVIVLESLSHEVIEIRVVSAGLGKCKLGITAGEHWNIYRPKRAIQTSQADVETLGRRVYDPLQVAAIYEELDLK